MKQQVMIRPVKLTDAEALYQLVDRNRANLRIWLPWVDAMHSAQDELNFLDYSVQKMANGGLWMMTILVDQQVVGMIDIHNLEPTEQSGEIGYWLTANQRGQGVMGSSAATT
ncbi:GNAT family N-acetyltransferase [Latilactobacillus fuchuensis]|uniref:GNAT family N-acetyltransferase n=1 Tax=Latilactobacillus fuchuensis TaxID=164393 RepID=UPI0020C7708F|nr:GNAT family protein [Latilactobacillus fuchuensis]MCP8858079.1 GNAT family N-acetyltransferase [Latilactobacillus fuchuensis]